MRRLAISLAVLLLLTGCASDPHPVPLTRAQRVALYERTMDAAWRSLDGRQPSAPRPDLRVQSVSSGGQWVLDIAGCLREQGVPGFSVTSEGQIRLTGDGGNSVGDGVGSVAVFVCQARHPRTQDLASLMSDSQLGTLYDYCVGSLQPCLLMNAGKPVGRVPTRAAFVRDYYTHPWSPNEGARYALYTTGGDGRLVLSALGRRCPPFPDWLPVGG